MTQRYIFLLVIRITNNLYLATTSRGSQFDENKNDISQTAIDEIFCEKKRKLPFFKQGELLTKYLILTIMMTMEITTLELTTMKMTMTKSMTDERLIVCLL